MTIKMKNFKKYTPYILIAIGVIIFFIFYVNILKNKKEPYLKVVFLDVGQGDAIFIQTPNKKQMLIDTGKDAKILESLSRQMPFADRSIDMVLVTHKDLDHVGGLPALSRNYNISNILESDLDVKSENVEINDFLNSTKISKTKISRGSKILLDKDKNIYLEIMYPDNGVQNEGQNETSVVARLVYDKKIFLFTGDANIYSESLIMWAEQGRSIDVDILKLGHHGAKTSSSLLWLEKTKPEMAIISAGKNNSYGHPHKEVLERLKKLNIPYLATYEKGSITIKTDGQNIIYEK